MEPGLWPYVHDVSELVKLVLVPEALLLPRRRQLRQLRRAAAAGLAAVPVALEARRPAARPPPSRAATPQRTRHGPGHAVPARLPSAAQRSQ